MALAFTGKDDAAVSKRAERQLVHAQFCDISYQERNAIKQMNVCVLSFSNSCLCVRCPMSGVSHTILMVFCCERKGGKPTNSGQEFSACQEKECIGSRG